MVLNSGTEGDFFFFFFLDVMDLLELVCNKHSLLLIQQASDSPKGNAVCSSKMLLLLFLLPNFSTGHTGTVHSEMQVQLCSCTMLAVWFQVLYVTDTDCPRRKCLVLCALSSYMHFILCNNFYNTKHVTKIC